MSDDDTPLKDRVRDYIYRTDCVTFAELANRFAEFRDGDRVLEPLDNLVVWAGLSDEAAQVMRELLSHGEIRAETTNPLVYLCDGRGMRLPIAKRVRAYKKPHWLPVQLRPVPK